MYSKLTSNILRLLKLENRVLSTNIHENISLGIFLVVGLPFSNKTLFFVL